MAEIQRVTRRGFARAPVASCALSKSHRQEFKDTSSNWKKWKMKCENSEYTWTKTHKIESKLHSSKVVGLIFILLLLHRVNSTNSNTNSSSPGRSSMAFHSASWLFPSKWARCHLARTLRARSPGLDTQYRLTSVMKIKKKTRKN